MISNRTCVKMNLMGSGISLCDQMLLRSPYLAIDWVILFPLRLCLSIKRVSWPARLLPSLIAGLAIASTFFGDTLRFS